MGLHRAWEHSERLRCAQELQVATRARLEGRWDAAQEALGKDIQCLRSEAGQKERAEWLLAQARVTEAETVFSEFTQRYPENPEGWGRWGYTLALLQRDNEARSALERAQHLSPNNAEVRDHLKALRQRMQ